ncbi:hypothetical protein MNB_SV-14-115 [hydrothermal vent metagenome]|uniref:Uncharacterized protein n=1 Tax=hydrothermal vent metagenome TaxID=652676 RepID=A0A1W1CI04_9ZZZZ
MKLLTTSDLTKELMQRMDKYNNDLDLSLDSQISICDNNFILNDDVYIFNSSKNGIISNFYINILLTQNTLPSTHDVLNIDLREVFKTYDISESEMELDTEPKQIIEIFEHIAKKTELSVSEIFIQLQQIQGH